MNSPDHRPRILSKDFRQVGIGASTGTYKSYEETTVCTVDFGIRRRKMGHDLTGKRDAEKGE